MEYRISLPLPEGWKTSVDTFEDECGSPVTHFEAHLPNEAEKSDDGMIDIYVGAMPEDSTAEDQAFSNYADIVGFDDDDPEDYNPIYSKKFNGKNAYCFGAFCEDDSPMDFLAVEIKSGVLAIICVAAKDENSLEELLATVEKGLRVNR